MEVVCHLKLQGVLLLQQFLEILHLMPNLIVIEAKGQALLGRETVVRLNVLKIDDGVEINSIASSEMNGYDINSEYNDCFQGLGKLQEFVMKNKQINLW